MRTISYSRQQSSPGPTCATTVADQRLIALCLIWLARTNAPGRNFGRANPRSGLPLQLHSALHGGCWPLLLTYTSACCKVNQEPACQPPESRQWQPAAP